MGQWEPSTILKPRYNLSGFFAGLAFQSLLFARSSDYLQALPLLCLPLLTVASATRTLLVGCELPVVACVGYPRRIARVSCQSQTVKLKLLGLAPRYDLQLRNKRLVPSIGRDDVAQSVACTGTHVARNNTAIAALRRCKRCVFLPKVCCFADCCEMISFYLYCYSK